MLLGDDLTALVTEKEDEKLFRVLCNYLSLSQFELARLVGGKRVIS